MQIWLIRHGKTQGNLEKRYVGKTDESILSKEREGLLEKKKKLESFAAGILDSETVLYTSPLKRCIETAQILFPNLPLSIADELRECDFGIFEYKNYQELNGNSEYQRWIDSNGTLPFPNGESQVSFQKRCVNCFAQLLDREKEKKRMILVVHGGTILALMSWYAIPKRNYFDWQTENGSGFLCEYCNNFFDKEAFLVCQSI